MGLDMYLYAEKHFSNSSEDFVAKFPEYAKERAQYEATMSASGMFDLPTPEYGGVTVSKCVGYWRKANAIHGWFIRNLANGQDNCQRIRVSTEDLIALREACNKALSMVTSPPSVERYVSQEVEKAELVEAGVDVLDTLDLEPTEGFFFGSDEKDEWYYECATYTRDLIDSLLALVANDSGYEFYYQSSW